jgi:thioredoxin-related protein
MLFGETVTVYCDNHTEQTDTVRTSQETHYVSIRDTNRLMLFGETVAVYCEKHTEHINAPLRQKAVIVIVIVIVIVYLFHRSLWLVPLDVEHVKKRKCINSS